MIKNAKNKMAKASKNKTAKKKDVKAKIVNPEIKVEKPKPKPVAVLKDFCPNCLRSVDFKTIFRCPKCGCSGCTKCGWDNLTLERCPSCGYTGGR